MVSLDSDSFYSLLYAVFTMPTMMFVKCKGDCSSVQLCQYLAIVYMSRALRATYETLCKMTLFLLFYFAFPKCFPSALDPTFQPQWTYVFQNTLITEETHSERLRLRNLFCAKSSLQSPIPAASSSPLIQCPCVNRITILIIWFTLLICLPVCNDLPTFSSADGKPSVVRTIISWLPSQYMGQSAQGILINEMSNLNILVLFVGKLRPREFKECCPSWHSEFELGLDLLSPDFDGFPSTFSWLFPIPYSVFFKK